MRYPHRMWGTLHEERTYTTDLSPEALRAAAREVVEPTAWPPALVLKLSGGGIVSRVMDAPATPKPFFGQVEAPGGGMRLALSSRGRETTPFQPLLLIQILPEGTEGGCRLVVTLRPHREAQSLSGLFGGMGILLLIAAIPALLAGSVMGVLALLVGVTGLVFPSLRARLSFVADRDRALAALHTHLPLTPAPAPPQ